MSGQDTKVDKLDKMQEMIDGMEGLDHEMASDLLWSYAQLWEDVHTLTEQLEHEGLLIEVEKGGVRSPRIELVKHPAYDMRHKAVAQLADLANKIHRFLALSDAKDDTDEFTDFMLS